MSYTMKKTIISNIKLVKNLFKDREIPISTDAHGLDRLHLNIFDGNLNGLLQSYESDTHYEVYYTIYRFGKIECFKFDNLPEIIQLEVYKEFMTLINSLLKILDE